MAQQAKDSGGFVQGYWFLGSKPSSSYTDYSWGQYMAQMATQQANISAYFSFGIGLIWADVERGSWTGTVDQNYQTVKGFCDQLKVLGFTPGIYSSSDEWPTVCGSNSAKALLDHMYVWTNKPSTSQVSPAPTSMANAKPFSDFTNNDISMWQYVSGSIDYDAYAN